MILLRLMGGLGNQMSQVAFAYTLARKNYDYVEVDTTSYITYKRRGCSIQKLKLSELININGKVPPFYYAKCRLTQKIFHVLATLIADNKSMNKRWFDFFCRFGHLYSFDSNFYEFLLQRGKKYDVYGYFLIEQYYSEFYKDISDMFKVKEEFLSKEARSLEKLIMNTECPIAISFRLQDDYINDPVLCVCSKDYFKKGIMLLKEKFNNPTFFVFADDINRAKKFEFEFEFDIEFNYIEGMTDVEGMHLMRQCKHFLISNSSFSWWGAYLSINDNKVIIAPDKWANNSKNYSSKYYKNMIKISTNIEGN
ncbi:MAG: alpha-1,2-fucosyltransferase [Pleomorphochaeta sp.]